MAKKAPFDFGGLMDAPSPKPIEGVTLRSPEPAPAKVEPEAAPSRKRGRPRSSPENSYARVSAHVDEATYRRVAIACLDQGIDRQEFLVRAIEAYLDGLK